MSLSEDLGIAGRVKWLGWRDGKRAMCAFDVLALPSRYEGLPYVALEALVAGLPIVTTSAAGCRLVVDHGTNGFIVPADRPDLFSDAVGRVITDPKICSSFGRASSARAQAFRLDEMIDSTATLYRELCATPSRKRQEGADWISLGVRMLETYYSSRGESGDRPARSSRPPGMSEADIGWPPKHSSPDDMGPSSSKPERTTRNRGTKSETGIANRPPIPVQSIDERINGY